jgi:P-type Ca2+ transporter type 2C
VARESSSLVLIDDNFASIVRAVRLGRRIFDNLRKAMSYVLAVHVPIAGMALLPVLFGWPRCCTRCTSRCSNLSSIRPVRWPSRTNRPSRCHAAAAARHRAPLFGGTTLVAGAAAGPGRAAHRAAGLRWASPRIPEAEARAFAFATLVTGNLALILSNRSTHGSLWTSLRTPNKTLWWVITAALLLLAAALYLPWAVTVLRFAPLPAHELAAALCLGMASVAWFEGVKWVHRAKQGRRGKP